MASPDGSSQTNLCNKQPFPVKSFPTSVRTGVQLWLDALMIVAYLSDSLCSARQRGKGLSERSELTPCYYYVEMYHDNTTSSRMLIGHIITLISSLASSITDTVYIIHGMWNLLAFMSMDS